MALTPEELNLLNTKAKEQQSGVLNANVGATDFLNQVKTKAPEKTPGFIQGMAQGIAKPFLKGYTSAADLYTGVKSLGQYGLGYLLKDEGMKKSALETASKEIGDVEDYGYFGKVAPLGTKQTGERMDDWQTALDVLGTGVEIGSYAVGAGAGKNIVKQSGKELLKQTIKRGATESAIGGGMMGFGSSLQGGDTSVSRTVFDTLFGTAVGTILGTLTPMVLHPKATVNMVRDAMSPLDKNVMSVLKDSPNIAEVDTTLGRMLKQAKEASVNPAADTPFETIGRENTTKALEALNKQLDDIGSFKGGVEKTAGKKNVAVDPVIKNFFLELKNRTSTSLNKAGEWVSTRGKVSKLTNTEKNFLNTFVQKLNEVQANPTVKKVADISDFLQAELSKSKKIGAQPLNTTFTGLMKETTHKLNQIAQEAGGVKYEASNMAYGGLKQLRDWLSKNAGTDFANSGSLMSRVFNAQSKDIKIMLRAIEEATGVPIFRDATLAKFAMDVAHDPRSSDALADAVSRGVNDENIGRKIVHWILDMVQDKEGKALRIMQERSGNFPTNPIVEGMKGFMENPKLGLSIEDVSKNKEAVLPKNPFNKGEILPTKQIVKSIKPWVHATTPEAAESISKEGFNLKYLGKGDVTTESEPIGVYFHTSKKAMKDYAVVNELEDYMERATISAVPPKELFKVRSESDWSKVLKDSYKSPGKTKGERVTNYLKSKGYKGIEDRYGIISGYDEPQGIIFDPKDIKVQK